VPAFSAVPVELSDDVRVRVPGWERHGPLGCSPEAVRLVREYETGPIGAIRGEGDPGITLDLDEFAALGAEVTAWLRNAEPGEETRVTLRVRPAGLPPGPARRWADAPMESTESTDGVSWRARLPVSAAGTYEVRVEAAGLPVSVPPAGDVIDVIDEEADPGSGESGPEVGR